MPIRQPIRVVGAGAPHGSVRAAEGGEKERKSRRLSRDVTDLASRDLYAEGWQKEK